MAEHKDPNDRINRGDKSNSYLGSTAFVGLRALDPLLQVNATANLPTLLY